MMTMASAPTVEILLVEDNPGDVVLMREAFRECKFPYHLSVAGDGEQAMDFLRQQSGFANAPRPNLILLDLNLPKKSGHEVLSEIKADPNLRQIPVVVLSTSGAHEDLQYSYNHFANCYITKPRDLDEFFHMICSIEDFWFHHVTLPRS